MARLYLLRRKLALIICPEMGVEARLKAARQAALQARPGRSAWWEKLERFEDSPVAAAFDVAALFGLLFVGLWAPTLLGWG